MKKTDEFLLKLLLRSSWILAFYLSWLFFHLFEQLGDIELEVMFVAPDEDSEEEGSQAGEDDNGFR